jgi:hypothetical protein
VLPNFAAIRLKKPRGAPCQIYILSLDYEDFAQGSLQFVISCISITCRINLLIDIFVQSPPQQFVCMSWMISFFVVGALLSKKPSSLLLHIQLQEYCHTGSGLSIYDLSVRLLKFYDILWLKLYHNNNFLAHRSLQNLKG